MSNKKLQILIPQYKETDEIIKPLLDSIIIQKNINFDDYGIIICNDGTDVRLSTEFLEYYANFIDIEYYFCNHEGVSATRNACLDVAVADYIMFCDADDMFYHCNAFWVFEQQLLAHPNFDTLTSVFIEEGKDAEGRITLIDRGCVAADGTGYDSTFVHGKIHRRQYLVDNNIRWNPKLTIHEDSYFHCLCQSLTPQVVYCSSPFYVWRWRDDSVCRQDKKYVLKTFVNMIDSSTALIHNFIDRGLIEKAQQYAVLMIFQTYFRLNKPEWLLPENNEFRFKTERRLARFYKEFEIYYEECDNKTKQSFLASLRNQFSTEVMGFETFTFGEWINHIKNLKIDEE